MYWSFGKLGRYGVLIRALIGALIFARLIVLDAQVHELPLSSLYMLSLSIAGFVLCVYQIFLGIGVIRNFADVHVTPSYLETVESDGVKQYQWSEVHMLQRVSCIDFPLYKAIIPNRKGYTYFSTRKYYWFISLSAFDFSDAATILRQKMQLLKRQATR